MPTPVKTPQQLGKSNLAKGKKWMYDFAGWLRAWFPGAEVIAQNWRADLGGLTEWTVECKNLNGDSLTEAVDQVLRDQRERGTRWHVVAKKRQGKSSPGDGFAVMTLYQWVEIAVILDKLEAGR